MLQSAQSQIIHSRAIKEKPAPLNQFQMQSIADRFRFHDAKLSTLAWETGRTQGDLCAIIVAIASAESFDAGERAERTRQRLNPPVARVN